jgi:uncharacterized BrkB/YihY/UPF0761 family membrane protein
MVSGVDRVQRRVPVLGVPLAVIYKYFEDQGNYLAAMLAFYAFIAIFPLLLLATSILGFILQGWPELEEAALGAALAQFPIIGDQLGRPEGLTGSGIAIVVGGCAALYGAMGLGLGLQNVQALAWGVPRNARPHPISTRFRSLLILFVAGSVILTIVVGTAVLVSTDVGGAIAQAGWFGSAVRIASVVVMTILLTILLRMAAMKSEHHTIKRAFPGALTMALLWQLLQYLATIYVARVIVVTEGMAATFAIVLGLMGMLYLGAIMGVASIQVNVVLARDLWPRALVTPFTDNVDLTDADRRAYAMFAQTQRHKGFQTVAVRFDGRDGDTHEIFLDPKTEEEIQQRIPAAPPPLPPPGEDDQERSQWRP